MPRSWPGSHVRALFRSAALLKWFDKILIHEIFTHEGENTKKGVGLCPRLDAGALSARVVRPCATPRARPLASSNPPARARADPPTDPDLCLLTGRRAGTLSRGGARPRRRGCCGARRWGSATMAGRSVRPKRACRRRPWTACSVPSLYVLGGGVGGGILASIKCGEFCMRFSLLRKPRTGCGLGLDALVALGRNLRDVSG